ncbi:unnamed protein product [Periconia digitata]|uniref:Uncharacterized protein n=1 Tax=Periconia digitata TaxID=1303443 RepID=A0A9W4XJ99_9PLEO|nr:unnamed protein product [Periconia digitata]
MLCANWCSVNSPALCPSGWGGVATFSHRLPVADADLELGPETSAVLCCPPQYTSHINGHGCGSPVSESQMVTYINPESRDAGGWDLGSLLTTTISSSSNIVGHGVVALWQKSDEAVLKAAALSASPTEKASSVESTPVPASSFTSSTASSTASSASAGDASPNDSIDGLSAGAKAGIGVGVSLVILIACVAAFFLWKRKRPDAYHNSEHPPPVELSESYKRYEAPTKIVIPSQELCGKPVEKQYRYELP